VTQTLDAVDDEEQLIDEEKPAAHHVGQDAGHLPPLALRATAGLCLLHSESDEILGVDVKVGGEEGPKLGIGVCPWETRSGDAGGNGVIAKERPGLAASRRHQDRGHVGAGVEERWPRRLGEGGCSAGGWPRRLGEGH